MRLTVYYSKIYSGLVFVGMKEVFPVKKKWLLFFLLGVLLMASLPSSVMAAQPITVTLNGEQLQFDVPPVLENGRVLVPLRAIFEALGATIDWDGTTSTVTATKGSDTVKLTVGNKTAYKNGSKVELDVPAKVVKGRTLVPVRFVSDALGALVEWDAQNQTVNITQRSELELQAIAQVEKYLSLLNRAVSEGVSDEEWKGILSPDAIDSGYGIDARVFRPMPGLVGSSGRSISNVEIVEADDMTGPNDGALISVVARYVYNDPTEPDVSQRKIQYEKKYYLILENEQLVIDREQTQAVRHADDIPLVTISKNELEQITQQWQQDNYYNYNEVLAINNSFVSPILSQTLGIIKWGNTSTASGEEKLKQLLSCFSPAVQESKGWQDFLNLEAKRDPTFTILWATSTQDKISATLYGELFPGFNVIPAVMEIDIQKQTDQSTKWIFTRIEKVRSYDNLAELEREEPQIYEMLLRMNSYRQTFIR
ncbi:copper amine oxidase N-terminal domain-containing protein [Thermoanaerobacteraceae bacterium SP2]|nr:copper amine oxidase N-terminal domain-containing protein [Thermoanaerobacteraceae bacterium SP2]